MTVTNEIYILTDYRNAFYSTIRNRWGICSLDIEVLVNEFKKQGCTAHALPYGTLNLRGQNFHNKIVLYQSSEDTDSLYKDYIEDLLLGINLQGGIIVPEFHFFRAHHNKVFMEILRDISGDALLQQCIKTSYFGTYEDFTKSNFAFPVVIKKAWGAGSTGVKLAKTVNNASKIAFDFSRSAGLTEKIKEWYRRLTRTKKGYVPSSFNRKKFIVQEFIPNLTGDYKVLVYWDKYYVVERKNRPGDFRASGSGLLYWPKEPPLLILNYAKHVFQYFKVPMISLDIALTGDTPALIECQFVSFGPAAMEQSECYFVSKPTGWSMISDSSVPEVEFVRSVVCYLKKFDFWVNQIDEE